MKIGLQLFTIRKAAQKNLDDALKRAADIGIKHIEAARIDFSSQNADIFCSAKEKYGTQVMSTQIKFPVLKDQFDDILDFHKKTDCKIAVISVLPTENILGGHDALKDFCAAANGLGKRYSDEGITLCYHHHDFEFLKRNGARQFNILTEKLEIGFVIDTYWATKGGFAADKLINKLSGRVKGVHLRDYGLVGVARKAADCALGDGVIDFAEVIESCKQNGVEYGAVEQKTKIPFEELQKSVNHIEQLGYGNLL
jgi:sugar phosphate isomerase/epimerase